MSSSIKVPGVVWGALLIAVTAFIQANFSDAVWYQMALVVIVALIKWLDVGMENIITTVLRPPLPGDPPEVARQADMAGFRPQDETALRPVSRSRFVRWLVG